MTVVRIGELFWAARIDAQQVGFLLPAPEPKSNDASAAKRARGLVEPWEKERAFVSAS